MSQSDMNSANRCKAASSAELIGAFVVLGAVTMIQLVGLRCLDLFSHPLWLDETITWRVANDTSFWHLLTGIAAGTETHPPTLYLVLWPLARLLGGLGNTELRVIALIWMLLGMTGLYAICRRFFARGPSIVAVLAVWAHPLIIDHAFETRFYSPWVALTAWFCYLQLRADDDEPTPRRVARYLLAIFATSIHYFGVISMGLMAVTDLLVHRRIKRVIPAMLGFAVVACFLPLIHGQRAGLSIPTWIERAGPMQLKNTLIAVFGPPSLLILMLVMWVSYLLRGTTTPATGEQADEQRDRDLRKLLPMSSLLLLPFVIIAVSILVQPSLVLRYLIVAIMPLAPLAAGLIERCSRRTITVAVLILLGMGAVSLIGKSRAARGLDQEFLTAIAAIDQRVPPDGVIVFKRRREMVPVLRMRPDLIKRSGMLDFDDAVIPDVTRMSLFERDMSRKVERIYPEWGMKNIKELAAAGKFWVVAPLDEYDELCRQLPGFNVADPESVLHEVTVRK